METISKRFIHLISELKMNNNSFAKSIGKSFTAIKSIVEGKTKPGFDILEAIFQTYPDINPLWLMTGEGKMIRGMAKVSDGGGAALEGELRERIKLQNDTISALQYTVELQKRLLSSGNLGKFEGDLFDRLPLGFPNFFGLPTGIVTGTPVSLRG